MEYWGSDGGVVTKKGWRGTAAEVFAFVCLPLPVPLTLGIRPSVCLLQNAACCTDDSTRAAKSAASFGALL